MRKRSDWIYLLLLLVALIFVFHGVPKIYFQNDEWGGLGYDLFLTTTSSLTRAFKQVGYHVIPLTDVLWTREARWFGLNAALYNYLDLSAFFLNVVVLYYICLTLTKRRGAAFFGALFFLGSNISAQSVTWIASGSPFNTLFGLAAIYLRLIYYESHKRQYNYLSLLLLFISLGFKEASIFLFPLFVIMDWLVRPRSMAIGQWLRSQLPLVITLLLYVIPRLLLAIFFKSDAAASVMSSVGPGNAYFALQYSIEAISQVFTVPAWIHNNYQQYSPYLFVYLSIIGMIGLSLWAWRFFNQVERKYTALSLWWIGLSVVPYIVFLKGWQYLDSRFYSFAATGGAVLVAVLFSNAQRHRWRFWTALPCLLLIGQMASSISTTRADIKKLVQSSDERRAIVTFIQHQIPVIGHRTVFYTESDRPYFGLAEPMMPFNYGFGYVLQVLYGRQGQVPAGIFQTNTLQSMNKQGYLEQEDFGFGYYSDLERLRSDLAQGKFKVEDVHAFSWEGGQMKDITPTIRRELSFESDSRLLQSLASSSTLPTNQNLWTYFFLKNGANVQRFRSMATTKPGLSSGWIGAQRKSTLAEFSGDTLQLPVAVDGYQSVDVHSLSHKGASLNITSLRRDGDTWVVTLDQPLSPPEDEKDMIEINYWVAVNQVSLRAESTKTRLGDLTTSNIDGIASTTTLAQTVKTAGINYRLETTRPIINTPVNAQGKPAIFVNGLRTEVKSITPDGKSVSIETVHPLKIGDQISLSVMVEGQKSAL